MKPQASLPQQQLNGFISYQRQTRVSSQFSREIRVSVSISVSKIDLFKSQSQSQSCKFKMVQDDVTLTEFLCSKVSVSNLPRLWDLSLNLSLENGISKVSISKIEHPNSQSQSQSHKLRIESLNLNLKFKNLLSSVSVSYHK